MPSDPVREVTGGPSTPVKISTGHGPSRPVRVVTGHPSEPVRVVTHGPADPVRVIEGHFPTQYYRKILDELSTGLVAYWMLDEPVGTTGSYSVVDSGGTNDGTPSAVTFGETGIGDGKTAPLFNGTSSKIDVSVGNLATGFNGNEGSLIIWLKVSSAAVWASAAFSVALRIFTNGTNYFAVQKSGATSIINLTRDASGTAVGFSIATGSTLGWFCLGYTWSVAGSYYKKYFNGVETVVSQALTNYVGNITNSTIGLNLNSLWWPGYIAHVAVWNTKLSSSDMASLGTLA